MDIAPSQFRTPLRSSWNDLLPGNSTETLRTGRYSLQIRRGEEGSGGSDQENAHGKMQLPLHMKRTMLFLQRILEERTNSGCGNHSEGCIQQSPVQAADGPAHSIWSQPNTDPVALLERTVVMQLGNWSSAPHQLTVGPPQGSPLSSVLFNVYTKGLADLNQNGPSKILRPADDGLIYKTSRDSQGAAKAVQQQLDVNSCGVMTMDRSSIQTRHKRCGTLLTTERQANQCQRSHLMELWSNKQAV